MFLVGEQLMVVFYSMPLLEGPFTHLEDNF